VRGFRESPRGLWRGGGPATVRNNIVIGGHIFREQDNDARMSAVLQDAGFDIWNPVRSELSPPVEVRTQRWKHLLQVATDYGSGDLVGVTTFWRHNGTWKPGLQPRVQQYYEQT
jgi:hypothetical protein